MQYTGAKPEVDQNIALGSWTRNLRSCNSLAGLMLIVYDLFRNDWNSLTYTFNHQIGLYKAFVNPEESFREDLFYTQITQNLLIYLRKFIEWGPLILK